MIKYAKELKYRALFVFLCWISVSLIVYFYKEVFLFELIKLTLYGNMKTMNDFIFTDILELFFTYTSLIFLVSNQITLVCISYNLLFFIIPGLYYKEYRILRMYYITTLVFWFTSLLCLYNYLTPFMWNFFLSFQKNLISQQIIISFNAKISEYVLFVVKLYYTYSVQIFFFASLFTILFISDNTKFLIKVFRKFIYFLFLLFSTFLTPPDIVSQMLAFGFLVLFFEIILMLRLFIANVYI